MTAKKPLFYFLFVCQIICAQQDSIVLKEVMVSDFQLAHFSDTQSVQTLNDSILEKSQPSLTALLNYNSVIYFKENGLGMVSSPSFRGTTAQQTAVIWNGININSQLNGQTDFNTIAVKNYDNVAIRAGGGSAIYGSSAIGGSIHLNNEMHFRNNFENVLQLGSGNFNTFDGNYTIAASNENVSANISISRNSSNNDFEYFGKNRNRKNENGQFSNTGFNAAFGYKLNDSNFLKLYSETFEGERHFSLLSKSDTKTKYRDLNTRNLLEWLVLSNRFTSKVKVAFISERYQYFENITRNDFYFGKAETFIAKYDLLYKPTEKICINGIVDFTQNNGNGSDINRQTRKTGAAGILMKHQLTAGFIYEISIRKEAADTYKSPLLFSVGARYSPFRFYSLRINGSRNFRTPTFNDLYWHDLGNPDLKPENSYQAEISNEFKIESLRLIATFYRTDVRDMIRWIPVKGIFSPENVDNVSVTGFEALLNYNLKLGRHHWEFSGTYAYTDSRNKDTEKQLIYVPFHKLTANAGYSYRRFSVAYQHLFNGFIFTQSDNNPKKTVARYSVSNVIAGYGFGKANQTSVGFKVLNLWQEMYESVESRPMPGRYYNLYLTFNF